jgi:membrane protein DedA with SNARE-associated domain
MNMLSLTQIYLTLINFQYLILLPTVIIEGPIISIIAGFLIAQGLMNIYLAYFIIIIGDLIGDSLYYALGHWGRNFGLNFFHLSLDKFKKIKQHFNNHSGKTILLSKLAHGIGASVLFVAGAVKMPFGKFLYYNALGTIPKSAILITIGYLFGESYVRIGKYLDYYAVFILILAIILTILYITTIKKIKKEENL